MLAALIMAQTLVAASSAPPAALAAALPACEAAELSLGFDGEGGTFDGMSQSGGLMVVRNLGEHPCRIAALPVVSFQSGDGHALAMERRAPPGMHPGPATTPVALAPEAEATAVLHWVSGDVYNGHNCVQPARFSLQIGAKPLAAPFEGRLCGPGGQAIPFEQAWLKTDPVLVLQPAK